MRLIALAAVALALPGAASAATRTFMVTQFDKVRIEGPFRVALTTAGGSYARAEGAAQALDRVRIEVVGTTLTVSVDRTQADARPLGAVTVTLATPTLAAATILGSALLDIDRARAGRFDLVMSGSGSARIGRLDADRAVLTAAGAGGAKIAGRVSQLRVAVQGSGAMDLSGLAADDVDLTATGTGDLALQASRAVRGLNAGSGTVTVTGPAACAIRQTGVGEVRCDHQVAR